MGRGGDSLLGPLVSGRRPVQKKEEVKQPLPEPSGTLLFQPFQKQDSNLYRKNPTPAALRRAGNIADEIKGGNFLPLLLVLDDQEIDIAKYPAFREIFTKISSGEIDKILKKRKVPRRGKEAKAEREVLEKGSAELLALRMARALSAAEDMPVSEQAEMLKEISFVDDSFLAELTLRSQTEGPAREVYVNALRCTYISAMKRSTLEFLTEKNSREGSDVFQEIMCREAVGLFNRIKHDSSPRPDLPYGCIRISYSGPSTMHIKNASGYGSICGSKEGFYPSSVAYGDWKDGPYRGDFKQCPKCLKAADQATLDRLNSERPDVGALWMDEEEQEKIVALSKDAKLKKIVRDSLAQGMGQEDIQNEVHRYMASRVADILASTAEKYGDGKNNVYNYGGGHLAWNAVTLQNRNKLQNLGYEVPGMSYRYRHIQMAAGQMHPDLLGRKDDVLLRATSPEERRKFLRYQARAIVTRDREKKNEYIEQANTILNRAVRRFLRNHS